MAFGEFEIQTKASPTQIYRINKFLKSKSGFLFSISDSINFLNQIKLEKNLKYDHIQNLYNILLFGKLDSGIERGYEDFDVIMG